MEGVHKPPKVIKVLGLLMTKHCGLGQVTGALLPRFLFFKITVLA